MKPALKRQFKDQLFEQFARIGKALSNGRRLELLELLAQRERTVEELAAESAMSVANCSRHLQVLRGAQLVEVRREGLYARYRLADEQVLSLWLSFRQLGEARLAEVRRVVETYLKDRQALQAITNEELIARLGKRDVVVLDVRPEEEFSAGHIAAAQSMPIAELQRRLKEIPKRSTVVAYCRGPYCVFADEAVSLLRKHGYEALRLQTGFPEWKIQGLPIATGLGAPQ
ncbi:MAG TPA: metalloregulator ArsR/SmtB family transcription factor [Candidatus Acidoferrales bacterium]|nr:metalloregulator ArsR/SmtB family transcription factor [Candidatus Acidoferrales bacterium]